MKRVELIGFGIPEDKIPGFQKVYWSDVKKQAAVMTKMEQEKQAAPSIEAMREATAAMLRLVYDPVRLCVILDTVNKEYHYQEKEKARQEYEKNLEELRQRIAQGLKEDEQAMQQQSEPGKVVAE